MRISDWSSDVCSSDLIVAETMHFVKAALHRPRDLVGGGFQVHHAVSARPARPVAIVHPPPLRLLAPADGKQVPLGQQPSHGIGGHWASEHPALPLVAPDRSQPSFEKLVLDPPGRPGAVDAFGYAGDRGSDRGPPPVVVARG